MINIGLDDAAFRMFLNLAGASVALYLLDVILKFLGELRTSRWLAAHAGPLSRWLTTFRPLILTGVAFAFLTPIGVDLSDADATTRLAWLAGLFLLITLIGEGLWRIGLAIVLAGVAWLFVATGFGLLGTQGTMIFGWLFIAAAAPALWYLGATLVDAFEGVPVMGPLANALAAICNLLAGTTGLVGLGAALIALIGVLMVGGGALLLILVPAVCVAILMGIFLEPFISRRESAPPTAHH